MNEDIKIVVVTHKRSKMPDDSMYLPLFVGAANKMEEELINIDYERDDTGDNISSLNPFFGTQTGLYWIWKNTDYEYKGLVHYRRFFVGMTRNKNDLVRSAINHEEIMPILGEYSVFVPKKRIYFVETLFSHYAHTHSEDHLRITRRIIEQDSPEYLETYDRVMNRTWGYMFNMMILRKDLMDDYCEWLFRILFQIKEIVDTSKMSEFEMRFCGRISELLFNVWLEKKLEIGVIDRSEIYELSYIEDVNWRYKVKAFFLAKFFNRKYGRSS